MQETFIRFPFNCNFHRVVRSADCNVKLHLSVTAPHWRKQLRGDHSGRGQSLGLFEIEKSAALIQPLPFTQEEAHLFLLLILMNWNDSDELKLPMVSLISTFMTFDPFVSLSLSCCLLRDKESHRFTWFFDSLLMYCITINLFFLSIVKRATHFVVVL